MQDKRIWQVINKVLEFEVTKGHLKWKVSELSRATKMNRSLIYYYLGSTKGKILDQCLQQVADEFYGLSDERMKMVWDGHLTKCLHLTRQMFHEHPEFIIFYFKWRKRPGEIQQKLIALEVRYRQKLKGIFPHWTDDEVTAFHGLMQGAVSSPFLDGDLFKKAFDMIRLPR